MPRAVALDPPDLVDRIPERDQVTAAGALTVGHHTLRSFAMRFLRNSSASAPQVCLIECVRRSPSFLIPFFHTYERITATGVSATSTDFSEDCEVPKLHPYLGERRVANQDRRMPAEERQPSAWKSDGWPVGKAEGWARRPAFLLMYMCSGAGNGTRTRDPLLGKHAGWLARSYRRSRSRAKVGRFRPVFPSVDSACGSLPLVALLSL